MNVQLKLSVKEVKQIYQILKAFDEGLIVNPSEEWELDHYDEKIADKSGLKPVLKKIEKSLPKEESEETNKTVLRRRHLLKLEKEKLMFTIKQENILSAAAI